MKLTVMHEEEPVFSSEYSFRDFGPERAIEAPSEAVNAEDFENR